MASRNKSNTSDQALNYARTCYDRLACELAVQLATAFEERGLIVADGEKGFALTTRRFEWAGLADARGFFTRPAGSPAIGFRQAGEQIGSD